MLETIAWECCLKNVLSASNIFKKRLRHMCFPVNLWTCEMLELRDWKSWTIVCWNSVVIRLRWSREDWLFYESKLKTIMIYWREICSISLSFQKFMSTFIVAQFFIIKIRSWLIYFFLRINKQYFLGSECTFS